MSAVANEVGVDWGPADKAHAKGIAAYIEFGQELAKLSATQEAIGERYDMSQEAVANAICVGKDRRIISNTNKLPKSLFTLYMLTTLDDKGFKEMAKPETRQADVLDYKKRTSGPVRPPPVSKPEGWMRTSVTHPDGTVEYREFTEEELNMFSEMLMAKHRAVWGDGTYEKGTDEWAFAQFGIDVEARTIDEDTLSILFKVFAMKLHPDRGGTTEEMSDLNKARDILITRRRKIT